MLQHTEESQIEAVEDHLVDIFGGRVEQPRIHAELVSSLERFSDARIRTYVPLLVQHDVAVRIRRLSSEDKPDAVAEG
jgi:hypothetical protein